MVAVQEPLAGSGHDAPQAVLAFFQREVPQIIAIAVEKIECVEAGFTTVEKKVLEVGLARVIEADDLTVEDSMTGTAFEG